MKPLIKLTYTYLALISALLPAQGQTYRLTDLGLPPGQQMIVPAATNNQAQVAGSSENFAYRLSNGFWENLGTLPGGAVSSAFGLNNAGQVVGDSQFTGGGAIRHAALFES